jgi:hypothetical protein
MSYTNDNIQELLGFLIFHPIFEGTSLSDLNGNYIQVHLDRVRHGAPVDAFIQRMGSTHAVWIMIYRFISENLMASPLRARERFPINSFLHASHRDQRKKLESQAFQMSTHALEEAILSDPNPHQTSPFYGMPGISRRRHFELHPNELQFRPNIELTSLPDSSRLVAWFSAKRSL